MQEGADESVIDTRDMNSPRGSLLEAPCALCGAGQGVAAGSTDIVFEDVLLSKTNTFGNAVVQFITAVGRRRSGLGIRQGAPWKSDPVDQV